MVEVLENMLKPLWAIFDWILQRFEILNIQASMLAIQAVAFAALGLGVWFLFRQRKELEPKDGKRTLFAFGSAVLAIVMLGIATDWVVQLIWPLPRQIDGIVAVQGDRPDADQMLFDCYVELLDSRGHRVVSGSGTPETETGKYSLAFTPEFSNPPRTVLAVTTCCDTVRRPISRRDLRARHSIDLTVVPK